ncbi:hypothetical protein [Qipengyuania citrea]|uniref:hypothetical protein n=1 Tax=Qipengyuania citrea TaxID=225971 RepID=UPI0020A16A5D|nr:hypothetical protein [Qipengyuania citrea]MCP2018328.1 putative membrane protein [Qipengyuania citrea]
MEQFLKPVEAQNWDFAPAALCACSVSVLISSFRVHTRKTGSHAGVEYTRQLTSELYATYVTFFIAIALIAIWAMVIGDVYEKKVKSGLFGLSLTYTLGLASYLLAQITVFVKSASYER